MKHILNFAVLAASALLTFSPAAVKAQGNLSWNLSYTSIEEGGQPLTLTATLTTSGLNYANIGGTGLGGYQILGITGERNGQDITSLTGNPYFPSTDTIYSGVGIGTLYDNALITSGLGITSPSLDNNGLSFWVGGAEYNVYSQLYPAGGVYVETVGDSGTGPWSSQIQLEITQVPEPTVASICGLGAIGLFGFQKTLGRQKRSRH